MLKKYVATLSARPMLVAAIVGLFVQAAFAGPYLTTYVNGATAGSWEVDRYAPSIFANGGTAFGRANVLNLGVAAADATANRPPSFSSTFYNTQGRGLQLNLPGYAVLYGSVYLPASWATSSGPTQNRRSDMWGVASPATGSDTCAASGCNLFPYIGFSNADVTSPLTTGGSGRFRIFDSTVGGVDLVTPVAYDQWNDVCLAFSGTDIRTYVNGALAYTQTSLAHNDVATLGPTTHFSRTIMQAYNFGSDYTVQWSNLGAGQLTTVAASAGSGQTTPPGSAFPTSLSVVARDGGGSPLPCVPVTFSVPGSGASATVTATTVITNSSGIATVAATANGNTGAYNVTATAPGLGAPATFALTNAVAVAVAAAPVPVNNAWWMGASALLLMLAGLTARSRVKRH